jgi:5-methylcytosine-specific restriction endonuclease McrA
MRKEFPKKVKLAAWQRSGGICECGCGVKIIAGDGPEYDHIIEDTIGGEPTLENCRVMRKRCHKAKTLQRRPEIDKTRRGFERRICARKPAHPMPCGRKSKWKKKLNGEVIRRD